jgi:ATP-binding cassette subfamily F protein 3
MESCDALLAAIDSFDGVVIMVTHNEMFLHALAQRLIVFQNDRVEVFSGSYRDFLEKVGWEHEGPVQKPKGEKTVLKLTKKELRQRRSEIITEKGKVLKPIEQSIAKAENDIERFEDELSELNQAMQKASQNQDGKKIVEFSRSIHKRQSEIDHIFDELEKLTGFLEKKRAKFEKKLEEIEK